MQFRGKLSEKLKYSTFLRVLFDGIAKLGLRLTPYYVVSEGIWGNSIPALEKEREDYTPRLLDEDDMKLLNRLRPKAISVEQLIQRLKDGHFCLGLIHEGKVVAFNWANPHESSGSLCRFRLFANEAYLYDMFTVHAHRGKKLAPYLRCQTYRLLSRKGMTQIYSISDAFNTPSVRFKKRLNARFVKLGISVTLLNRHKFNFTLRESPEFKNRAKGKGYRE